MTMVRNGDSSSPTVTQATLATLTDAINNTLLETPAGVRQAHHISKATAITLGVLAVVPIVVVPIVNARGSSPASGSAPVVSKCPNPSLCG